MAYNQNIPAATDLLSISQGDIQANFQSLYATILANHASFSPNADFGKHTMVQLVPRAAALAGNPGFWANSGSANDIMIRNNAGNDINITTKTFTAPDYSSRTVSTTNNYFYVPCGLLVKFGTNHTDASGHLALPINLHTIGAPYTSVPFALVSGTATPPGGGGQVIFAAVRSVTNAALDINTRNSEGNPISGSVQWLTIGLY